MLYQIFAFPIHLLLSHGYEALFVWSVLEGEIGLMLAGWLAAEGRVFDYQSVVAVAMAGAFIGDVSVFLAGRLFEKRAMAWLDSHPGRRKKAMAWLRRWGPAVIVFERFVYGTHIPVLLTIGMSGYRFWKFLLYDVVGIILWAFTFVTIGYRFGDTAIQLIMFIQKNVMALLLVAALFAILWLKKNGDDDD
ncbi:DedA family protein [Hydrogenimonas sp.]